MHSYEQLPQAAFLLLLNEEGSGATDASSDSSRCNGSKEEGRGTTNSHYKLPISHYQRFRWGGRFAIDYRRFRARAKLRDRRSTIN